MQVLGLEPMQVTGPIAPNVPWSGLSPMANVTASLSASVAESVTFTPAAPRCPTDALVSLATGALLAMVTSSVSVAPSTWPSFGVASRESFALVAEARLAQVESVAGLPMISMLSTNQA